MAALLVLLVEDSESDAELLRAMLPDSIRVEHLTTIASACDRLSDASRDTPSVVLMDLTLPDSAGEETYGRLARSTTRPIVVMSGDNDPKQMERLRALGASDFLVKGEVGPRELATVISRLAQGAPSRP